MGKIVNFNDLPDTITPEDYSEWRRVSLPIARQTFHSRGFPLIKTVGRRLIASKHEVFLFETSKELRPFYATEFAKKLI